MALSQTSLDTITNMAQIPEYQVETRDIDNYQTRQTGGHAETQDFDPFSEQAARSLSEGFDQIANSEEKRATKEDMVWAQTAYAKAQVNWIEKIKNYTDPDAAMKDLQDDTTAVMKNAPTGRASDFFVSHMDQFAPRMARRAVFNQAKAETNAVSSNYVDAANSIASLANGFGNQAPMALQPDSSPATPPPVQPRLNSKDLGGLANQVDQLNAAAKGVVPQNVVDQTTATTKSNISRGMIAASVVESSPGEVADKLHNNPDDVILPQDQHGQTLSPDEIQGTIATLRARAATQPAVAVENVNAVNQKYLQAIKNGNSPSTEELTQFASQAGSVLGGKGGKKDDSTQISLLTGFKSAQDTYNMGQKVIGVPPMEAAKLLNDYETNNSDKPAQVASVKAEVARLDTDLRTQPGDYALNNPSYRASYNSAFSNVMADTNPATIGAFQRALTEGVEMQAKTGVKTVDNAGVMPKHTADSFVQQIQGADVKTSLGIIHKLQDVYGDYFDNAMADMTRSGLNQSYSVLSYYRGQPMEGRIASAIEGEAQGKDHDSWDKLLNAEDPQTGVKNKITDAVASATRSYQQALGWNDPGAKGVYQIQNVVASLTKQYMYRGGMGAQPAAEKAANDVINSQFDVATPSGSNRPYLISKKDTPGGDTASVRKGLDVMRTQLAGGNFNPDIGGFFGRPGDANTTPEEKDSYRGLINNYGFWVNSPDGKGVRLAVDGQRASIANPHISLNDTAGTGIWYPVDKKGAPFDVPYGMAQTWANHKDKETTSFNGIDL